MSSAFGQGLSGKGPRSLLQQFGKSEEAGEAGIQTVLRLLSFMSPYRRSMITALLLMLFSSLCFIAVPYLLKLTIDLHIAGGDVRGLIINTAMIALLFLGAFAATSVQNRLLSNIGHRFLSDLRNRFFIQLQRLSLGYHSMNSAGGIISRIIGDVAVIKDLLSQGLVNLIGDVALLTGIVAMMLAMDVKLAMVSFTILPIMILITFIFTRRAREAFQETRTGVAAVVGDLAENISGMRIIQAFGQEDSALNRFDEANRRNRDANVAAMSLSFIFMPSVEFLSILAMSIVLAYGGIQIVRGTVTIGTMVAFLSYVTRFFQPLQELGQLFASLQAALAGGQRTLDFLDAEPEVRDRIDAIELDRVTGRIVFDHVRFSYGVDKTVLNGVDFTADPGTIVAIVGKTGAGKTTIINLIARFYDVDEGSVSIDGFDVRKVTQKSLRKNMGVVSQDPFLFTGTIRNNIRLADRRGPDDRVEEAARLAMAHEFISGLPEGYETPILEGGSNLSTGQKQLISIARALYTDPRIIMLDEATANVDTITESRIQAGLQRLFVGRTAVVVAHRLTTVLNADRIIVLQQGYVLDQGNHMELIDRCGVYRELYEQQFIQHEKSQNVSDGKA